MESPGWVDGASGRGRVFPGSAEKPKPLKALKPVTKRKRGDRANRPDGANGAVATEGWGPRKRGIAVRGSGLVRLMGVLDMVLVGCSWSWGKRERPRGSGPRWFLRGIRIRLCGGELRANAASFRSAGIGPNGLTIATFGGEVKPQKGRIFFVGHRKAAPSARPSRFIASRKSA